MSPALPAGACDTHLHFYASRFPVAPRSVLRPPDASLDDYRRFQRELGLTRAVVVQPTTYGTDNRCQLEAAAAMGPDARTVVVVDDTAGDPELERLTAAGVCGARFHLFPDGAVAEDVLPAVAARVEPFGWHIQLQLDGRQLAARLPRLLDLRTTLVVDHVGLFLPPVAPEHPSFRALQTLVEGGRCWVKLSAPYLSSAVGPPDYPDVGALAHTLIAQAPERMLWASNWPHPGVADPPDGRALVDLLARWAGDEATIRRILVDNPAELYGF